MLFPCEFVTRLAQPTLSVRTRAAVRDLPQVFGKIYGEIIEYLNSLGAYPVGAAFAIYYNMDMENLDLEAGFPIAKRLPGKGEIHASEIPAGKYAVSHYTGPYDKVGPAYEALVQWAEKQGYKAGEIAYEWYLNGPDVPPQDLKTDIMFPVTKVLEKQAP